MQTDYNYADDILIYTTIQGFSDCQRLQKDLHTQHGWAKTWQMNFNPSKCLHLTITNKCHSVQFDYHIHTYVWSPYLQSDIQQMYLMI